ncbi:hypothetical protein [Methylocystis sp. SB2]|uniref:hypothetical protein n=1 Tax=Methylocystis sp. (strain SB2) TaxID=743836 RepID=UPI0003FD3077|nr:hypothetical protein [Methylocystis sp. SB2]ULO23335.1 hypothetical protein LNB28_14500 [Methylocystis sp. SB2]
MKRTFALTGVLSFLGLSGLCAQTDQRVWTLGGLEEKNADSIYLGYGVPESDDSLGSFTCAPGSGLVKIWIAETSNKLKAGGKSTAIFSVGEKTAKVAGKLVPNEEAGVPSFEGSLPAKDPIFAAMVGGETLDIAVGGTKRSAPLADAAEKFKKFAAACAKR